MCSQVPFPSPLSLIWQRNLCDGVCVLVCDVYSKPSFSGSCRWLVLLRSINLSFGGNQRSLEINSDTSKLCSQVSQLQFGESPTSCVNALQRVLCLYNFLSVDIFQSVVLGASRGEQVMSSLMVKQCQFLSNIPKDLGTGFWQ